MPRSPARPAPVRSSAEVLAPEGGAPVRDSAIRAAVLLTRCQKGDERALAELVQAFQPRIYRLAARVCGDPALAEEAAVETFYKVWTRSGQWRGCSGGEAPAGEDCTPEDRSAETWIYRVAVRTVLDLRRGRRRWWQRLRKVSVWDDEDPAPGPAAAAEAQDEQHVASARLTQALETLKPGDQLLIHLYYDEGRSLAELEALLETPSENLKMRLSRARARLREALERMP